MVSKGQTVARGQSISSLSLSAFIFTCMHLTNHRLDQTPMLYSLHSTKLARRDALGLGCKVRASVRVFRKHVSVKYSYCINRVRRSLVFVPLVLRSPI